MVDCEIREHSRRGKSKGISLFPGTWRNITCLTVKRWKLVEPASVEKIFLAEKPTYRRVIVRESRSRYFCSLFSFSLFPLFFFFLGSSVCFFRLFLLEPGVLAEFQSVCITICKVHAFVLPPPPRNKKKSMERRVRGEKKERKRERRLPHSTKWWFRKQSLQSATLRIRIARWQLLIGMIGMFKFLILIWLTEIEFTFRLFVTSFFYYGKCFYWKAIFFTEIYSTRWCIEKLQDTKRIKTYFKLCFVERNSERYFRE